MKNEISLNDCPICKSAPELIEKKLEDGAEVKCTGCKNTGTLIRLITTGEIYVQWHYH